MGSVSFYLTNHIDLSSYTPGLQVGIHASPPQSSGPSEVPQGLLDPEGDPTHVYIYVHIRTHLCMYICIQICICIFTQNPGPGRFPGIFPIKQGMPFTVGSRPGTFSFGTQAGDGSKLWSLGALLMRRIPSMLLIRLQSVEERRLQLFVLRSSVEAIFRWVGFRTAARRAPPYTLWEWYGRLPTCKLPCFSGL